ncbi:MAG TPA: hypothetical protein DDZ89_09495 [Clostridiales bacterium]|mgnify:CR=1 FL=1|nr:hypothetical protein [Clostridiales bacterium]
MLGGYEKVMSKIQCRSSRQSEIEQLKDLWEICFGDDRTYIDLFFKYKYKESRTFVLTTDNVIAAMVTAIDVIYTHSGKKYPSVMLYAVATHPSERGKGFSTLLMDYVNQEYSNRGVQISVLVPADKPLIGFYKKRGYTEAFSIYEGKPLLYMDSGGLFVDLEPVDADAYNNIRTAFLEEQNSILYSNEDIFFQQNTAALSKGNIFQLQGCDGTGCAIVERISPEKILVKELLIKDHMMKGALKTIIEHFAPSEVIVRLPKENPSIIGSSRVFGMAKVLDPSLPLSPEGYLGLAFD